MSPLQRLLYQAGEDRDNEHYWFSDSGQVRFSLLCSLSTHNMCVYMYVHVCTCMYMYVHVCACMYMYVHVCTCMCMYVHVHYSYCAYMRACYATIPLCM